MKPIKGFLEFLVFLLVLPVFNGAENSILDDFEKCKKEQKFGITGTVLCDPDDSLRPGTISQLNQLLNQLKDKVTCNCENGCSRGDNLPSDFIGLLLVSSTDKIDRAKKPLAESAQQIYEEALLGNATCDNGLLIVYIKDKQKLATYRGGGNFLLFTDSDMQRLHQVAVKGNSNPQDQSALRYLLTNYDSLVERNEIHRADSWTPLWGLILAFFLLLLLLAILAACIFAFCCTCCRNKTRKKNTYQVTPISTYKPTPEPIYIVTPPPPPPMHRESIYTSPLAISPPHPSTFTPHSPPPNSSRAMTPTSTQRTKVVQTPTSSVKSPKSPEQPTVARSVSASSKTPNKIVPVSSSTPEVPSHKPLTSSQSSPIEEPSDQSIDMAFLDPRRPREIQTRKDYIY